MRASCAILFFVFLFGCGERTETSEGDTAGTAQPVLPVVKIRDPRLSHDTSLISFAGEPVYLHGSDSVFGKPSRRGISMQPEIATRVYKNGNLEIGLNAIIAAAEYDGNIRFSGDTLYLYYWIPDAETIAKSLVPYRFRYTVSAPREPRVIEVVNLGIAE